MAPFHASDGEETITTLASYRGPRCCMGQNPVEDFGPPVLVVGDDINIVLNRWYRISRLQKGVLHEIIDRTANTDTTHSGVGLQRTYSVSHG